MSYCKNCGAEIGDNAAICVKCGCAKGNGTAYCPNCGKETLPGAAACTNCGVGLHVQPTGEQKSKLAAGLLALFLGGLGIHNFYLGYTGKGIAQILLSCTGVSSVWALIEGIMIFCGKINVDAKGVPLKD